MFFGMGLLEVLAVLIIAIVVLGPEKLPKAVSELSGLIRKIRSFSSNAQADIRRELGPEFTDLHLRDLHPKALVEQALLKADEESDLREIATAFDFEEPLSDTESRQGPSFEKTAKPEPTFTHEAQTLSGAGDQPRT
ncbi:MULTISPECIES: Sec-independent protein translocase TatB [Streptomyces]|uniref:Sec-independent protein translocase TatB n=1 Tax=Streptomyces pratisoli TaxID=3139917 RepID=A0ACC6QUT2_9ACTN|nr:Sec-independent protein translocase TatB [Streptomyces sp. NBC_00259]